MAIQRGVKNIQEQNRSTRGMNVMRKIKAAISKDRGSTRFACDVEFNVSFSSLLLSCCGIIILKVDKTVL